MPRIAIIGYCQTVASLNAIGCWQQSLRQDLTADGPETESAFGTEHINTKGRLFDIIVAEEFSAFNDTQFCLLNKTAHPAAHFIQANEGGKLTIWYSDALKQFMLRHCRRFLAARARIATVPRLG